jgi:hypothetical protein
MIKWTQEDTDCFLGLLDEVIERKIERKKAEKCPDCGEPKHEYWWDCEGTVVEHVKGKNFERKRWKRPTHAIRPDTSWRDGLGGSEPSRKSEGGEE